MSSKISISRLYSILFILVFMLALAFSALGVTPAHAAGIRYAKPGGTGDCSSWANACTLQTALTGAVSGDEIWVMAGTYTPGAARTATFQLIDGVALYGGFTGTEAARSQRNPATHITIMSGDLNGDDAVFTDKSENAYHVVTGATGANLDGFTITAGNANSSHGGYGSGGGMYNDSSSPTMTNVTFSGNSAKFDGGGMDNWSSNPTLTNVLFSNNSAGTSGGGMGNSSYSSPTLTNVTFSGNSAYWYGGGMWNTQSSPTLTNVTFIGNSAYNSWGDNNPKGGGMYNVSSNPTLTNVTFSGNSAMYYGGGMYNSASNPTLTNVTFRGNSALSAGGGIYNYSSSPQIRNNIFWSNTAPGIGAQIYNNSSVFSVSYSVVQDGYAGGTNIVTADPMLGTLGNYGGFTQTIPLLAGSSAIDTGDDATCAATDQRGITRPQGAHCDIGAFEWVKPFIIFLPLILR